MSKQSCPPASSLEHAQLRPELFDAMQVTGRGTLGQLAGSHRNRLFAPVKVAEWHDQPAYLDDYSRSILAWKLQWDMTAHSPIQVVQLAIDATGMTEVLVGELTRPLE